MIYQTDPDMNPDGCPLTWEPLVVEFPVTPNVVTFFLLRELWLINPYLLSE